MKKISKMNKRMSPQTLSSQEGMAALLEGRKKSRDRLPMLEIIFDRFLPLVSKSMEIVLGEEVKMTIDSLESIPFGSYKEHNLGSSLMGIFKVKEWKSYGGIVFDQPLIFTLLGVLLKGSTSPFFEGQDRSYTSIEKRLIEKIIHMMIADLEKAFSPIASMTFLFEQMESTFKPIIFSRPDDKIMVARIAVVVGGKKGLVDILLPCTTLEPIRGLLSQNFIGEKFGHDLLWEDHLAQELYLTEIDLYALLDEIHLPLEDILSWQVGTHISLNVTPHCLISLKCGKFPLFMASAGQKSGKVAVKIDHFTIEEKGRVHVNAH